MDKKDRGKGPKGCDKSCGNIEVPTEDELAALNAMRAIKERVRDLKKRISEITPSGGAESAEEQATMEQEMVELKRAWREWEDRRKEAARQRMILLGHEEK